MYVPWKRGVATKKLKISQKHIKKITLNKQNILKAK